MRENNGEEAQRGEQSDGGGSKVSRKIIIPVRDFSGPFSLVSASFPFFIFYER